MKKSLSLIGILTLVVVVISCKKNGDTPAGPATQVYLDLPAKTAAYYGNNPNQVAFFTQAYIDSVNKIATLGRVLFYDNNMSVNNAISCASCHKQQYAFADNVAFSTGFESRLTKRNSPPIQNLVGNNSFSTTSLLGNNGNMVLFWDGRENNVQNLITRPVTNHVEMGISDFTTLPAKLGNLGYYKQLFTDAYGTSEITQDRITSAVAYFISSINSTNSRFSQALTAAVNSGNFLPSGNPNITGLSAQEQQGYSLFIGKYNCGSCHHIITDNYTIDQSFMDSGLDPSYTDNGRGAITNTSTDNGKFKVPSLHNVGLTAPYMHDGRFTSLDQVLEHYSHGINNSPNLSDSLKSKTDGTPLVMNISTADKQAIIAFLNTFTDNQMINDTKFSTPFKVK